MPLSSVLACMEINAGIERVVFDSLQPDPMEYTFHGILQARILEWAAFPFSKGSFQPRSTVLQADSLPAEPREAQEYLRR